MRLYAEDRDFSLPWTVCPEKATSGWLVILQIRLPYFEPVTPGQRIDIVRLQTWMAGIISKQAEGLYQFLEKLRFQSR